MHQIIFHLCALCHPVEPYGQVGSVNMIVFNLYIHCPVKFYPGHFSSVKQTPNMDIMNRISFDDTKGTTHAPYYACLFTKGNCIVANKVASHSAFVPPKSQRTIDGTHISLCRFSTLVIECISI